MVDVWFSDADYRKAAVDLWESGHLATLDQLAKSVQAAPQTPPQGLTSEAAAAPSQPASPAVPPPAPVAADQADRVAAASTAGESPPPYQPDHQAIDDWARTAISTAWKNDVLGQLDKGEGPVVDAITQTLANVPQQAQGWARGVLHLPQARPSANPSETPPVQPAGIAAPAPSAGQVATVTGGAPGAPSGYEAEARQAAQRYGLDPDLFVRQLNQESGLQPFNPDGSVKVSPAGARGVAQFMPETARGMGINPDDPEQSIDAAARLMRSHLDRYQGDYSKALAAYNAGPGNVDQYGGVPPFPETQRYVANILNGAQPAGGQTAASAGHPVALNRPSQFQVGLSDADAYAACGPVAALTFARAFGRNPTMDEAMQLARQAGWDQAGGMNGIVNEKKLFDALGVPAKLETGQVNWDKVTSEVQNGNPVVVSTPGHYFTIDDSRSAQGGDQILYHVGTSGTDLKAGSEWMTQAQIEKLEGQANGVLFADHPQAQGPSFTESGGTPPQPPTNAIQVKAIDLWNAVQNIGSNAAQRIETGLQSVATHAAANPLTPLVTPSEAVSAANQFGTQETAAVHAVNPLRDVPILGPTIDQLWNPLIYAGAESLPAVAGSVLSVAASNAAEQLVDPNDPNKGIKTAVTGLVGGLGAQRALEAIDNPAVLQAAQRALQSRLPGEATSGFASGADALAAARQAVADLQARFPQMSPGSIAASGAGRQLAALEADAAANPAKYAAAQSLEPRSPEQLTQDLRNLRLQLPNPIGETSIGGLPPNEALPGGPQPGQLQFGSELPMGGPRPTGTEALARGPQPGQMQLESELPLGGPKPTGTETQGPAGPLPGQMRLPGFPNPQTASGLDIFRAYHTGDVVSDPATTVHVAINSFVSPAWSFATRGTADTLGGVVNAVTGLPTGNMGRAVGRGAAVGQALTEFGANFFDGLREFYANPANTANRVDNPIVAGLLKAQQATGAALHSAFQNAAQAGTARLELAAQAGDRAWAEGARGQDLLNRIGELINDPPPAMLAKAQDVGQRAALRGSAGTIQQLMENIASVPFIGNTLFPVVRIGAQSVAQITEASPVGLLGTAADVARFGLAKAGLTRPGSPLAGPYAQTAEDLTGAGFSRLGGAVTPLTDRLTNNLAGVAATAFLAQKGLDGTVTGTGPADPKVRAMLQSQGWQPNSTYVPGYGYVPNARFGRLALVLDLVGNFGDTVRYAKPQPGQSAQDQVVAAGLDLTNRVADSLAGQTGLRTLGDLADVLRGKSSAGTTAATFAGQTLGGFVPESAAVRSVVGSMDPYLRQIQPGNVQQVIQQGLPGGTPLIGGRTDLPLRLDVLGRPEMNPQTGAAALLPRTGTGQPDPTLTLLANAGIDLAANSPKTLNYAGKQIQLTPAEQQLRQEAFGQRLQQVLQGYVNSTRFQALPPDQQYKALEPLVRSAGSYADQRVLASIPAPDRQARAAAAPRAYGAGVVPYLGPAATTMARMVANQANQAADARHAALMEQLRQPLAPAAAP